MLSFHTSNVMVLPVSVLTKICMMASSTPTKEVIRNLVMSFWIEKRSLIAELFRLPLGLMSVNERNDKKFSRVKYSSGTRGEILLQGVCLVFKMVK